MYPDDGDSSGAPSTMGGHEWDMSGGGGEWRGPGEGDIGACVPGKGLTPALRGRPKFALSPPSTSNLSSEN